MKLAQRTWVTNKSELLVFPQKSSYIFLLVKFGKEPIDDNVLSSGKRNSIETAIMAGRKAARKLGYEICSFSNIEQVGVY